MRDRRGLRGTAQVLEEEVGGPGGEDAGGDVATTKLEEQARDRPVTTGRHHQVEGLGIGEDLPRACAIRQDAQHAFVTLRDECALELEDRVRAKARLRVMDDEAAHVTSRWLLYHVLLARHPGGAAPDL